MTENLQKYFTPEEIGRAGYKAAEILQARINDMSTAHDKNNLSQKCHCVAFILSRRLAGSPSSASVVANALADFPAQQQAERAKKAATSGVDSNEEIKKETQTTNELTMVLTAIAEPLEIKQLYFRAKKNLKNAASPGGSTPPGP
jgi:hypothetical protein